MAKFARRLTIFSFFSVLMLAAAAPAFGGGGKEEADLARADQLINELRHDEAIQILTEFARRNPDKFDQAQQRFRRIYQIRDEFNRTADLLVQTLMDEPENDPRILELSRHLYTLEHEDSPLLVNFVARTREIAQFNVNRALLRRILERGRAQLERGESFAALQIYAEGMTFMRDEFFAAGFTDAVNNEVIRETQRINSMLSSFQQISSQMGSISAEMIRAVNAGETARIPEITTRLNSAMDRFIAQKQGLYVSFNSFNRILNGIRQTSPEMGDRNHLSFLSIIIRGSLNDPAALASEGMLGAFDNYWENSIGAVITAITQVLVRSNQTALTSIGSRNFSSVLSTLNGMEYYVNLTPFYFDKHRQLYESANQQTTTLYGSTVLNIDIPKFMEIRALSEANNVLVQASAISSRYNIDETVMARFQDGSITTVQALAIEQQTRVNITAAQRSISDIITRGNQVHTDLNRHHNVMHVLNAVRAVENIHTFYIAEEQRSSQRFYVIAHRNLANNLVDRKAQLERGRNFLSDENRYPAEALAELTSMLNNVTTDIQTGNAVLDQYSQESPVTIAIPEISATRRSHQSVVNELNDVRTQGMALAETARSRSMQAESYRQEGERLFREAQAAFQRRDYDTAIDRIGMASRRLSESLDIQESASVRDMHDNQLITLSNAIGTARGEAIIAEVRNLVNNARTQYFAGNFNQAEDNLIRARNSWRIVNQHEENEEVVYWLNLVRTALSATSGRVIPPTAPLYPEMSQLLSQAQRNYDDGVRLVNSGQRTQGIARFEEARQLTREVRLMFPINQEAGLLELRIEQFLDPVSFNSSFEQRLRTAQAGTRARSMEAFADLLNLAEINPRYPNMRAIVNQAEIDIGVRPPPPNPADVAESRDLTAAARRIIDSNNTAQYPIAMTQLNRAISLNRENQDAPRLRDQLNTRMNNPGGVTLTLEDEASYQRALRELQAGNNLVAYALVERLLQNPNNRNVTKVVELQRRIATLL